jgi:hypothetical protein
MLGAKKFDIDLTLAFEQLKKTLQERLEELYELLSETEE